MKTNNDALLDISNNKKTQIYIDTFWLLKHSMKITKWKVKWN